MPQALEDIEWALESLELLESPQNGLLEQIIAKSYRVSSLYAWLRQFQLSPRIRIPYPPALVQRTTSD